MVGYWKFFVKRKLLIYIVVLVILGLLTYLPAMRAEFVLDDEGQIIQNTIIRSLSNFFLFFRGGTFYGGDSQQLIGGFYRPVMTVLFAMLYAVVGLNPFAYHLLSILIHVTNAILVFILFRFCFKRLLRTRGDSLPFLLAAVFLVHPMMTSGVAYVAALNEPLFFLFGITGLLIVMHSPDKIFSRIAALGLFFLGLLSKETTILFIATTVLYLRLFQKKYFWNVIIGSAAVFAIYIGMRCGIAHMCDGHTGVGPLATMPLERYIIQLPAMVFFYLYTFVAPVRLSIAQEWIVQQATITTFFLPLLVEVILLAITFIYMLYLYYRATNLNLEHKERNATADLLPRAFTLFLAIFLMGLVMHLHILPLDFTVDEHWFYFPSVGLLGMIGIAVPKRRLTYAVFIAAICLFSNRTYLRTQDWHDNYRLFSHDIQYSSDSPSLTNNLATELFRLHRYNEAHQYFLRSTRLDPTRPVAWTNLGIIAELNHIPKDAKSYYRTAIEKGRYYKAYELYASLLIRSGEKKEAAKFLKSTALPLFPHNTMLKNLYKTAQE